MVRLIRFLLGVLGVAVAAYLVAGVYPRLQTGVGELHDQVPRAWQSATQHPSAPPRP